ncbi:BZ3500_MvSof-1268-A1-R1_Chr12-2g03835 [Microbotryum saponariae]|uniref:BZ3500_MvSof-1268-A1-R1_Chr12-2g03835 protein n=1 Tax=Microbotryum saponariae TaxID=289078 RepID=A0A2X0KRU7_9BASI|nr:BZ3500_MvSof-1268-A1-R1_Chr12-2g03835 [Microbotryum saponariae]
MQWHGRLNFVPLRIRVRGQNDLTRQTTPSPTVRLSPRRVIASPVKRSAMDAELNIDLSSTDGHEDEFEPAIPH